MDKNRLEEESKLLLEPEVQHKRKSRWLLIPVILISLGYGVYRWGHIARPAAADSTNTSSTTNPRGRRGGGTGRASVVTVPARRVDMPVYLRGLGTAAASNTVTVRSRVDGQLIRVAFKEGQFVKQGDLLAEIDKRPFEVQLSQAKGQLARDEALLESAKAERQRNQLLLDQGLIPKQQYDTQ